MEKNENQKEYGEKRDKIHNYDSRRSFANTPKGSIVSY